MTTRKRAALQQKVINDFDDYKIRKPSPLIVIERYTDNTNRDQLD